MLDFQYICLCLMSCTQCVTSLQAFAVADNGCLSLQRMLAYTHFNHWIPSALAWFACNTPMFLASQVCSCCVVLAPQQNEEHCSINASLQLPELALETASATHGHISCNNEHSSEDPHVPQVCLPLSPYPCFTYGFIALICFHAQLILIEKPKKRCCSRTTGDCCQVVHHVATLNASQCTSTFATQGMLVSGPSAVVWLFGEQTW